MNDSPITLRTVEGWPLGLSNSDEPHLRVKREARAAGWRYEARSTRPGRLTVRIEVGS